MPLDIAKTKSESIVCLNLRGTLEIGSDVQRLTDMVKTHLEAGENQILLDLGGVRYIDSTGISVLIQIYSAARDTGGAMKLIRLTQRVHDVLQITRLSSVFEIYNDPEKAIESFRTSPAGRSSEKNQA